MDIVPGGLFLVNSLYRAYAAACTRTECAVSAEKTRSEGRGALRALRHACGANATQSSGGKPPERAPHSLVCRQFRVPAARSSPYLFGSLYGLFFQLFQRPSNEPESDAESQYIRKRHGVQHAIQTQKGGNSRHSPTPKRISRTMDSPVEAAAFPIACRNMKAALFTQARMDMDRYMRKARIPNAV